MMYFVCLEKPSDLCLPFSNIKIASLILLALVFGRIINTEMLRFDKWYKISVNMSSLTEILEPDNIKGNYTAWNSDLQREYKYRLKSEWTFRDIKCK